MDEKNNGEPLLWLRTSWGRGVLGIASVALVYFATARLSLSLVSVGAQRKVVV